MSEIYSRGKSAIGGRAIDEGVGAEVVDEVRRDPGTTAISHAEDGVSARGRLLDDVDATGDLGGV